jgi:hypothetical protein
MRNSFGPTEERYEDREPRSLRSSLWGQELARATSRKWFEGCRIVSSHDARAEAYELGRPFSLYEALLLVGWASLFTSLQRLAPAPRRH